MSSEPQDTKPSPEALAKLYAVLKNIDPTWKGGKPEIRPPVELPPRADGRSWVEVVVEWQQSGKLDQPGPDLKEN